MTDKQLNILEILERVVVMETKIIELEDKRIDGQRQIDKIVVDVQQILSILSNQKGFVAGVVFTVGALFSVVLALFGWFHKT